MFKWFSYTLIIYSLIFFANQNVYAEPISNSLQAYLVDIKLNQTKKEGIYKIYLENDEIIWIKQSDLKKLELNLPEKEARNISNESYYNLAWFNGMNAHLDKLSLQLSIEANTSYFPIQHINGLNNNQAPFYIRPKNPGAFFNYDVTTIKQSNDDVLQFNALTQQGFFNHLGVGTNDVLYYNHFENSNASKWVRLDTQWQLDQPETMTTWILGDSITSSNSWSGATRFAGIQYATNFSTQPYFITFPLPGYKGEAILPSSVDILVNNVKNQSHDVPSGEFYINNIPVVTGAGIINIVTQDALHRSQIVSLPYYVSPSLLKPGLAQFSYETGLIRNNYGIDNNDYGRFLVTGTYQYGITDQLTLGTHGEFLFNQQTLGVSSDYLWQQYGIISTAFVGSHNPLGQGILFSLGFNRQTTTLSYGFKTTLMSKNFLQIGLQPGPMPTHINNQVFIGYQTIDYGSYNLSYTGIKNRAFMSSDSDTLDVQKNDIVSVNYNRSILHNIAMALGIIVDLHQSVNNQIFISFTATLDAQHSFSAYTGYQDHQLQPALEYSKNLPLGNGYGYHLLSANNPGNSIGADASLRNNYGTYTAKAFRTLDINYYELDATGGIVYFGGETLLSNKITDSFALVHIPGTSNVRVYYQNQLIGRTNSQGNLLIPQILPYQRNIIDIDPRDIPLDVQFTDLRKEVVPYYLSGAFVTFDVKQIHSLILHLVTPDGQYIPSGAAVTLADHPEKYYAVGYEGLLYIIDAPYHMTKGKVQWENNICEFTLAQPKNQNRFNAEKILCQ